MTIVFVVFNRRDELRESMKRMLTESDYHDERVDVIVVDNASEDGSSEMVSREFPQATLITRDENIGAPAWNDGFAVARGEYVLVLDDDCYLPPDGLRQVVAAAQEHGADLVSLSVASTLDPEHLFTESSPMGLLSFWGCAWLVRRSALSTLGGYDPGIFIWDNELEFTLRFYDRGFRHLHLPEVVAQHMKPPLKADFDMGWYRANARHFAYIATKLLCRRDAAEAIVAVLTRILRDALREQRAGIRAIRDALGGVGQGLSCRAPVRPEVSRFYRTNFPGFAAPWRLARPPSELIRALPRELRGRRRAQRPTGRGEQFFAERAHLYPREARTLQL